MPGDPLAIINQAGQSALALPGTILNMGTRHITEGVGVLSNEISKAGMNLSAGLPQIGAGLQLPVLGQGLPPLPFGGAGMGGGYIAPPAVTQQGTRTTQQKTQIQKTGSYLEK